MYTFNTWGHNATIIMEFQNLHNNIGCDADNNTLMLHTEKMKPIMYCKCAYLM